MRRWRAPRVLVNLSASNITIGKADYRRELVTGAVRRAAWLHICIAAAGPGESTTDLAWDGHAHDLRERQPAGRVRALPVRAAVDHCRNRSGAAVRRSACARAASAKPSVASARGFSDFRTIACPVRAARARRRLLPKRAYERFPYVPSEPRRARRALSSRSTRSRCRGCVKRLQSTGIERVVIGISGGLDSTQALLVCRAGDGSCWGCRAPTSSAYTMPGFATSARTLEQAHRLMRAIGCQAAEIDIRPTCTQMLQDIGHPYAERRRQAYDVTFENVQAGRADQSPVPAREPAQRTGGGHQRSERTRAGLVHLRRGRSHVALRGECQRAQDADRACGPMGSREPSRSGPRRAIRCWRSSTPNSVRSWCRAAAKTPSRRSAPRTSSVPYELQDFHLYYTLRFGYPPPKVAFLAYCAWHDAARGGWPDIPLDQRRQYGIGDIKKHLRTFLQRFFGFSQFKRSAIPNGPKVGSGGSLSPRGDYRAPSDSEATAWLETLDLIPDQE